MIEVNNIKYDIVKNYRDAFDKDEFIEKCTDYFNDYDYIVGDIAYGKLRLKGFYDEKNKKVKDLNNYKYLDNYLKNNCAVDCKYFVLKRRNNESFSYCKWGRCPRNEQIYFTTLQKIWETFVCLPRRI